MFPMSSRHFIVCALLGLVGVLALPAESWANAFTLPEGSNQVGLILGYDQFDELYVRTTKVSVNNDQNPATDERVIGYDALFFWNHGVSDRIDFQLITGLYSIERDFDYNDTAPNETQSGATDLAVQGKIRLWENRNFAIATSAQLRFPGDYDPDIINTPGDGVIDLETVAHVSYADRLFTVHLSGGYQFRSDPKDNSVLFSLETGVRPVRWLYVAARWEVINSQGGAQLGFPVSFRTIEEDVVRVGGIVGVTLNRNFSVLASYNPTIDGRNTSVSNNVALGVIYSF